MANIIFCKPGTEIVEISPPFTDKEKVFDERYSNLSMLNKLKYNKIVADTIDVEKHSELSKKYIHPNILSNSNYYKNLILKLKI